MGLSEAIEILKVEKGICDLDLSNGNGNEHSAEFSQAVDVVVEFVDRCVCLLMR